MGMIILLAMVGLALAFLTAIICAASIGLGYAVRALAPAIKLWLLALLSSALVVLGWFGLLLMIPLLALDSAVRGPEVLGFMIVLALAVLSAVIVRPTSFFFTLRYFRKRQTPWP